MGVILLLIYKIDKGINLLRNYTTSRVLILIMDQQWIFWLKTKQNWLWIPRVSEFMLRRNCQNHFPKHRSNYRFVSFCRAFCSTQPNTSCKLPSTKPASA